MPEQLKSQSSEDTENNFEQKDALVELKEESKISMPPMPEINIDKLPKREFYWHATLTGADGSILEGIISKGLKPKEQLENKEIGNFNTPTENMSFVANYGSGAVKYLKHAEGYNYEVGGLPMFVVIKVEQKNKDFRYDTDIVAGTEYGSSIQNKLCWFSLFLCFDNVDEFVENIVYSFPGLQIKKALTDLSGQKTADAKEQFWKILNSMGDTLFFEGQRLDEFLKNIDVSRWDKFLTILNKIAPKGMLTQNLGKKEGWDSSDIKLVYIVTPNGDSDWKKWAALMPPEIITRWEEWGNLTDKNGNKLPGNGKMIRVEI